MSELLKSHAVGLPEAKHQQRRTFDKTCWVDMCISKESKKLRKLIVRKVATSTKTENS